jgi:hypothetical protein
MNTRATLADASKPSLNDTAPQQARESRRQIALRQIQPSVEGNRRDGGKTRTAKVESLTTELKKTGPAQVPGRFF